MRELNIEDIIMKNMAKADHESTFEKLKEWLREVE